MFTGWNRFIFAVMVMSALLAGCGGSGGDTAVTTAGGDTGGTTGGDTGGTTGGDTGGTTGGFTVTGKIILANGTPVSGVSVKLYKTTYTIYPIDNVFYSTRDLNGLESIKLDPAFVQSLTNEQGVYSFSGVYNANYTIVPTSGTHVFKWSREPTRNNIGVITLTESGMVYIYNPEGGGNKLSDDSTIIYNTGTPFIIPGNTLDGQDFEASLPGGSGL